MPKGAAQPSAVEQPVSDRVKRCPKCRRLLPLGAYHWRIDPARAKRQPCRACVSLYLRVHRAGERAARAGQALAESEAALISRQASAIALWASAEARARSVVAHADTSSDAILRIVERVYAVAAAAAGAAGPRVSGAELADQIEAMRSYTVAERRQIIDALRATLPPE